MRNTIDKQAWYREPWPWILMSGPAIVVVAGISTAWVAVSTSDGLVADDYYKQGLGVNQRLQRDHRAQALQLHADLMQSGLHLRALLTSEKLVMGDTLRLTLAHPTQAGADVVMLLKAEGGGVYGGTLPKGLTGRWYVALEDIAGDWRLQGDWVLGQSSAGLRLSPLDEISTPKR